jgi:peptidoglycan hydrolase CwlO-like protein
MSHRLPHRRRGSLPARAALAAALATAITSGLNAATLAAPGVDQIDAQRAQVRALEAEVTAIDAKAEAAADAYAAARARVAELRRQIRENTTRLRIARASHRDAQKRLAERLVALYAEEPPSFVELLMSSGSVAGALNAHAVLDRLREQDAAIVISIERSRARLVSGRNRLVADRAEAEAQLAEASARDAELRRLTAARRGVLRQARGTLNGLVTQAQLAAAQRAREAALAARAAAPAPAGHSASPAPATAGGGGGGGGGGSALDAIARCESGGNPRAVSPDGQYRGKYQFSPSTWQAVGGSGDPAAASEAEQDRRAAMLYAQQGSSPWPICGA